MDFAKKNLYYLLLNITFLNIDLAQAFLPRFNKSMYFLVQNIFMCSALQKCYFSIFFTKFLPILFNFL